MALLASVGQSQAMEGREAGLRAAQQALDRIGRGRITFGWVIASHSYQIQQVVSGVIDLLGEVPLLGFSTSAELTGEGRSRRSVVVGLLAGDYIQARANWWPDFIMDSQTCVQNMLKSLQLDGGRADAVLVVTDGLAGDAAYLCEAFSSASYSVAGCQAGGEVGRGRTFQVGGRQAGNGGLSAAVLLGNVIIGVGAAHGWRPVGSISRLTRVQGFWVRTLDEKHASETYARLFGYPAREWAFPPLSDMVRLYPLGLQDGENLIVRSPLRIEADGSLRMNTRLPEGKNVDLMIGSRDGCLEAARQATRQALAALGPMRPRLAVLLVDVAWQTLLETQPGNEVEAVREVLGNDVPILGGYTFGQVARLSQKGPVQLLNQHIEVILFSEKDENFGKTTPLKPIPGLTL